MPFLRFWGQKAVPNGAPTKNVFGYFCEVLGIGFTHYV